MTHRSRPTQVKREREQQKRERQRKKAEKAAARRQRRAIARSTGTHAVIIEGDPPGGDGMTPEESCPPQGHPPAAGMTDPGPGGRGGDEPGRRHGGTTDGTAPPQAG